MFKTHTGHFIFQADIEISTDDEKVRSETNASVEDLLLRCGLCLAAQDLLADYILLEDYYMSANIKRAMENDAAIVEGHVTSVMLDDVFFLLKKCIQAWLPDGYGQLFRLYCIRKCLALRA